MPARVKRLGLLILAIASILTYWGCQQPEDVITPVGASRLTLRAQRLPSTPSGTVYELWATNGQDTIPIARFVWNNDSNAYFETNGTTRRIDGNAFILPDDIYDFRTIFISVEPTVDSKPNSPSAIMLIDTMTSLETGTTRLRFPRTDSLFNGFTFLNYETPSDSDYATNDGYGVWFSAQQLRHDSLQDTLSLNSYTIDTNVHCEVNDTIGSFTCPDSVVVLSLQNIRAVDTFRIFGFDTVATTVIRYDSVIRYSSFPYIKDSVRLHFTLNPPDTLKFHFIGEEFFGSSSYLPDISAFGWVYRGWVMSPSLNGGCGNATFSQPAWINTAAITKYLPQGSSMMISTGAFNDLEHKDMGNNPYSSGPRVPNFPGEDFLQNLPCGGGLPTGGFVPGGGAVGSNGAVFISIEPKDYVAATNFPLIALTSVIPTNRNQIAINGVTGAGSVVAIPMFNWTSAVDNDLQGFPLVIVDIERL